MGTALARGWWLAAVLLLLAGAYPPAAGAQDSGASLTDALAVQLETSGAAAISGRDRDNLALLTDFYRERALAPLWVGPQAATARAIQLAEVIQAADGDGLDPADYDADTIATLLPATEPTPLAELEFRLSLALLELTSDLGSGRLAPSELNSELFVYPQDVDPAAVITAAVGADDLAAFVAGFAPDQAEYRRLKAALANHRAVAAAGGWPLVAETDQVVEPGDRTPMVASLRARLQANGDVAPGAPATGDADLFDEPLVAAVLAFQGRHGLEQDGRIGRQTLAALNVPVEARIEQMILNLERRRWMPDDRGRRYVFVNLADFELKLVDDAQTLFDTRVVVGAPYHRTPVFSDEIAYVELNPFWNVPNSIARNEILPKLQEDPGYLAERNFDLLSDWSEAAVMVDPWSISWDQVTPESFSYRLRQGPGPNNALGRMKFMFPNDFSIYLHDTPARSLFEKTERSFSHGCIRVEHPETLAAFVLAPEPDWSAAAIESAIATEERIVINLGEPLPIHIDYVTAFVNKDGSVHFRGDIYGRDRILATALLGPDATLAAN